MSDTQSTPTDAGQGGTGDSAGAGSADTSQANAGQTPADQQEQQGLTDPVVLQKELEKARGEAARYRTERNSDRTERERYAEQIKAINKALGIESDEPDVEGLQKTLAEREIELRTLKVENAFTRSAKTHEADEELTLAVLTRNGVIAGLDPSSSDFTAQLDAAVKTAVEANPKLKATQVATKSGSKGFNGNDAGSRSAGPSDLGSAIQKAMT